MTRRFAQGRKAWAICQRSGKRLLARDLVVDGQIPGLLVAPDWYEPKHPQEIPPHVDDPIAISPSVPDDPPPTEGTPAPAPVEVPLALFMSVNPIVEAGGSSTALVTGGTAPFVFEFEWVGTPDPALAFSVDGNTVTVTVIE